jgi:ankyrin repeat protein
MQSTLTPAQAKEFLLLCRTGRLYEVERWINAGNALHIPAELKKVPLLVAIETGFHSLIELLVRNETDQCIKDQALLRAVFEKRLDFVELLVANGARVESVPFEDVLLVWDPKMIQFFLDHGADPVKGAPFAIAFEQKIRTSLRFFKELKTNRPEIAQSLQEQADAALRHFCCKGDLKWISLMLWVGANSRSLGPTLGKEYTNDPEGYTTALIEACSAGNIEVLKKLKPNSTEDNLSELLDWAALSRSKDLLVYLLDLGANPNGKTNGGSQALDRCLWHLNWSEYTPWAKDQPRSKYEVRKAFECITELVRRGARWVPDERYQINSLRRCLCECEPAVATELLQLFVRSNVCSPDNIKELLKPPRMKAHLSSQEWHLARIGLTPDGKPKVKPEPTPSELMRRYNRDELYEKVWSEPTRIVAKGYGVSDVWLAKVCKWLKVPTPGRGYWAKKNAGKPVRNRPPLPTIKSTK